MKSFLMFSFLAYLFILPAWAKHNKNSTTSRVIDAKAYNAKATKSINNSVVTDTFGNFTYRVSPEGRITDSKGMFRGRVK